MSDASLLRALNDQARNFMRMMVTGLSDEQVRYSAPAIDERSIAGVVLHAYSSMYMLAHSFADKQWPAMPAVPTTTADLLKLLDEMHDRADQALAEMSEGAMEKLYTMPWGQKWTGAEASAAALGHCFMHAGAIQGIRALGGFPTPPELGLG